MSNLRQDFRDYLRREPVESLVALFIIAGAAFTTVVRLMLGQPEDALTHAAIAGGWGLYVMAQMDLSALKRDADYAWRVARRLDADRRAQR